MRPPSRRAVHNRLRGRSWFPALGVASAFGIVVIFVIVLVSKNVRRTGWRRESRPACDIVWRRQKTDRVLRGGSPAVTMTPCDDAPILLRLRSFVKCVCVRSDKTQRHGFRRLGEIGKDEGRRACDRELAIYASRTATPPPPPGTPLAPPLLALTFPARENQQQQQAPVG
jgi:hypothetical protein